jgi:ketosteroid isomerase-like protein
LRISASLYVALLIVVPACAAPQPLSPNATDDVAQIRTFLAHIEQVFVAGNLDAAVAVFTDDAMIVNDGTLGAEGKDAIRALYASALATTSLHVRFHTEEIASREGLAYERGTYTLDTIDKATGQRLGTVTKRHLHILKKEPNGEWRTWRMFTDSTGTAAPREAQMTVTKEFAEHFEWIEAWNSHDLDRILSHYSDDFVMSSPRIVTVADEPTGVLRGKGPVGAYWKRALELTPNLRYQLLGTFVGADSVALHYRGPRGLAVETFFFGPDGRVVRAAATYDR